MSINKLSEEHIITWRRYLHEHPELSFQEYETSQYVYDILNSFGVYTLERITETSVIATLKGPKEGPTIALRADMDALPIHEEADVPFKSKVDGVMHACGHDTHTAILLGAAEVIATMIDDLSGTVKLIFQHAEELAPGGAQELVKKGVMNDVDYVFGLHIFPMLPTGSVVYLDGPMTAASDTFKLTIQGKGSHGSMPDLAIDPITIGAELVNALNNIVSREINSFDTAVISVGKFVAGDAPNVIPDSVEIAGTVRTLKPETRAYVEKRIRETIEHTVTMHNATYKLDYSNGYDSIRNDKEATELIVAAASKVVPEQLLIKGQTMMGSEDFSSYTNVKPGSFIGLGGGLAKDGYQYINHNPKFIIDEKAMLTGSKVFVQLIEDLLMK